MLRGRRIVGLRAVKSGVRRRVGFICGRLIDWLMGGRLFLIAGEGDIGA